MAARGAFEISNPDGVEMTLTITMSIQEWKVIKQRLRPAAADADWQLDNSIKEMIDKAGSAFRFYENPIKP